MSSLTRAKELADEWATLKKHSDHTAHLGSYFHGATPDQLISMWETGKNLKGHQLSQFEVEALVEAWCKAFGELPPSDGTEPKEFTSPEPASPEDDTMLDAKEVVRLTGLSLSTLKRMVQDGRFPTPLKISERRIGWPAQIVKDWLAALDRKPPRG